MRIFGVYIALALSLSQKKKNNIGSIVTSVINAVNGKTFGSRAFKKELK